MTYILQVIHVHEEWHYYFIHFFSEHFFTTGMTNVVLLMFYDGLPFLFYYCTANKRVLLQFDQEKTSGREYERVLSASLFNHIYNHFALSPQHGL